MKTYAGIGNRKIDFRTEEHITWLANRLMSAGWFLRSGGALGSDQAFEDGHDYTTRRTFRPSGATQTAINLAMAHHPAPSVCAPNVRKLHGRNAQIILGENLDEPVDMVVAYAVSELSGGTALGIRIARHYGIRVENLYHPDPAEVEEHVKRLAEELDPRP